MGFLRRMFGTDKPAGASTKVTTSGRRTVPKTTAPTTTAAAPSSTSTTSTPEPEEAIPAYRIGLTGEYDESGLAKRVALAFDEDAQLDDVDTLWVAQLSGTVVLKGQVPNQDILNKMVTVAKGVDGAEAIDTSQVTVG
jgi:osmotically-inducible protein OsmY